MLFCNFYVCGSTYTPFKGLCLELRPFPSPLYFSSQSCFNKSQNKLSKHLNTTRFKQLYRGICHLTAPPRMPTFRHRNSLNGRQNQSHYPPQTVRTDAEVSVVFPNSTVDVFRLLVVLSSVRPDLTYWLTGRKTPS